MSGWGKAMLRIAATVAFAGPIAPPCWAIDYQPFDWFPLPPGTSAVEGYYEFGKHDAYNSTLTGTTTQATKLDSDIGVARFIHYDTHPIFGHQWDFNFLVPFGSLRGGEIGGYPLHNASGVGDPIVSAGM